MHIHYNVTHISIHLLTTESNKKRILTLHRSFVINLNTIKFAKFEGRIFCKENILLLLKTFELTIIISNRGQLY